MRDKLEILSYGTDPEFLLKDERTGKLISSFGIIPGEKNEVHPLTELGPGYSIQKDNVLVEFCVPIADNVKTLYDYTKKAIDYTNNNLLPKEVNISIATTGYYEDDQLDNPFAKTFGCSPSYNAWTRSIDSPATNNSNFRSTGFHLHFGLTQNDPDTVFRLIRLFDLFLGVPSVIFDEDRVRRKQYGKAGEFRPTEYGVEYRVLGGYVMQSKSNFDAIEEGLKRVLDMYNSDFEFTDEDQLNIQQAINTNNTKLAGQLIDKFEMHSIINKVMVIE